MAGNNYVTKANGSFNFRQLNCHKEKAAMANLELIGPAGHCIMLLQEPYNYKGTIPLGKKWAIHTGGPNPRAAIATDKSTKLWPCDDLSDNDCVTCVLSYKTKGGEEKSMILVSLYCDITQDIDNSKAGSILIKVCEAARKTKQTLIIGMDSNAHSCLWGHETNKRGEALETIIVDYGLKVENIGKSPTFRGRGSSTIIDVTLSMNCDSVEGWKVVDEYQFTDHAMITFSLDTKSKDKRH